MSVAVISKTGERLMPTSEYRARKLLKSKKAIIHGYHPFTIQLTERDWLCSTGGTLHGHWIYTYRSICKIREARISGRAD